MWAQTRYGKIEDKVTEDLFRLRLRTCFAVDRFVKNPGIFQNLNDTFFSIERLFGERTVNVKFGISENLRQYVFLMEGDTK